VRKVNRILALLLIMALIITQLPMTALAEDAPEGDIRMEIMSLPPEALFGGGYGGWALERLGSGIIGSTVGYGVNQAFNAIFGSETDAIFNALNEIKSELKYVRAEIINLSNQLDEKELKQELNSFATFFSDYVAPYEQLCGYIEDLGDDSELTDMFMQDLYLGNNRNIDTAGETVIAAAKALGNRTTLVLTGGYNIFGAFDKLERYKNRWEHQGYDLRERYRKYIITVYDMYNAMGQIACTKMIEAHQGDSLNERYTRLKALRELTDLKDNAAMVSQMNKRCAVIRHPKIRIYRDIEAGTDKYAFHGDVGLAEMPAWCNGSGYFRSVDYMRSFIGTNYWASYRSGNGGTEHYSVQPWWSNLRQLYLDYGSNISLYHILFDADKGNFNNIRNLPEGKRFASNYYLLKESTRGDTMSKYWYTNVVGNKGEMHKGIELGYYFCYKNEKHATHRSLNEQFFDVHHYFGGVVQGALQAPNLPDSATADMISGMEGIYELPYSDSVTLSVQEAVYADYQWFVDRGDDYGSVELEGETSAAYTLPELEPSMNGWMYRCAVMEDDGTEEGIYTLADPVTLRLTGEGVPDPVTEHEVGSVEELTAALERVVAGDWYWHTLKLTGDIEYPLPISLTGVVTIDLGNYTLKVLPRPDAQPNIDPEGDTPKVAAIYVYGHGFLETKGDGQLNVIAGEGVDYGVYARDDSTINVHNVTLEDGGNAVLATWGGIVNVDSVAVAGEKAIGVECFDGGNVSVAENITVSGDSSYGIYMSSGNYFSQSVCVGGDVRISGANSRGTYLDDENAELTVNGNVSVNGGTGGVLAGQGNVEIGGGISAPGDAVNAWYGASVTVQGDAVATGKEATAVNSSGADVHIQGNVTSSGQDGTGIYAAAWDLFDPAEGAKVTVDGQISAATPLWIENFPVEENEYVQETTREGYLTYTDGTNTIWVRPGTPGATDTYTVTFDKNGGDTEASPAVQEAISGAQVGTLPTAPARSGYTFIGWNTQANGSGTAFTAATEVTDSITLYAQWRKNSSGSSGDSSDGSRGTSTPVETPKTETNVEGNTATATTTVTATVDSSGNTAATVSRAQVSDAISKAMEEAEKQGEGTVARVKINVEASADATTAETIIPKEAVSQASEAGIGALTISTPVASITLDANTLSALSEEAIGDMEITASKVEASSLSPEAQRKVGDRPVFDFTITSGDKTISQFGGDVSVFVPYTPKEGEDTNAIIIYYINDSGKLEIVGNCIYDPKAGRISFSTRHFSQYAVGYNKVSFKDVAENAWYSKAVGFIAAREITAGTGGGNFSPEAKLTRGQFIVMLMKSYGISPDINTKVNFADAGNTYYTGYLAAAKRLGISTGVGDNLFAPEKEITRQEMFTLLYKVLKVIGKLPQGNSGQTLSDFSDTGDIASWAQDAMTFLVETGTVSGSGGKLSPISTTTRAEMAQVLYSLLSK
jgi:uncharacterized repeat protein (TIGR02543 family)